MNNQIQVIALTAVNLNHKYLACVPTFIDFWLDLNSSQNFVQYTPKVVIVANKLPEELNNYSQWCEVRQELANVSSVFTSQVVRILQPSLEVADFVLSTDVDMLPLSDLVFLEALNSADAGAEFVVCRDVLKKGQYPICYNFASPTSWRRLNNVVSEDTLVRVLLESYAQLESYSGERGGVGWFRDQEFLYKMVTDFESKGGVVSRLSDRASHHKRFDRGLTPFPLNWLALVALAFGSYTDYHVHHPIRKYSRFIRSVKWVLRLRKELRTALVRQ